MRWRYPFFAALLIVLGSSSTSQVQRPIDSAVILRSPLTSVQTEQLNRTLDERPATAVLTVDPSKVRNAAGTQPQVVDVAGTAVVPVDANSTSGPVVTQPPPVAPTRVGFLKTTLDDEIQLKKVIASQGALRQALSLQSSSLITIPGIVQMSDAVGAELKLKPFILVNRPLQRNQSGMFEGELLIGVTEIADSSETRQLPTPLLFEIAGAVKSIPERILVETTSPPFRRVRVLVDTVQDKVANLMIVSVIDRNGTQIALPLAGEISIGAASDSIEGLGLEATEINVMLGGSNAAKRKVTLGVAPSGYIAKSLVTLDADGTAQTTLRSGWIGAAVITATNPDFKAATKIVYYRFPVRTLTASLLGALLGALASFLVSPARPRSSKLRRLFGSMILGIIVFGLYAVGVNVLPIEPKVTVGAVLVFVVSAVGAIIGPKLAGGWSTPD